MRKTTRPILAALALAFAAAPAAATQFAYDFATHGAVGSQGVAVQPTDVFTGAATGANAGSAAGLTATISGWNFAANSAGAGSISQAAYLGKWDGGLGVIATQASGVDTCGQTWAGCGEHQIDNSSGTSSTAISRDFVQITFSKAVTLASVTRVAFADTSSGTSVWDDDFAYGSTKSSTSSLGALTGNVASESFTDLKKMISTDVSKTGGCNANYTLDGEKVCYDWTGVIAGGSNNKTASTTWWIAASLLNPDSKTDAFKLYDFTVLYNDNPNDAVGQVPEPSSWMTMIAGFGFVGWGLRRKKAAERLAAA